MPDSKTAEGMLREAATLLEACRGYFTYQSTQGDKFAPSHEWERPIIEWLDRYIRSYEAEVRRTCSEMPDLSAYLTVRDAAQLLEVSRQRVYRMIAKKQLPAVRVGQRYRVWLVHEDALPMRRMK